MKRLLIFLDGTWNAEDSNSPVSNIVLMRELIDFEKSGEPLKQDTQKTGESVTIHHRVYYDSGVGTGWTRFDKWVGGAIGRGLDSNIREAYRFLSENYEENDEIFIFGFSRGAFTARSLAGFVSACGLLKREHCTRELEKAAWSFYLTPPKDRFAADRAALDRFVHTPRIKCLGVFDTVGALGIPFTSLRRLNQRKYQFHDTELGEKIDHALHAVAIDEIRWPFRPALWVRPPHRECTTVEQVWFAGGHADIGGGNVAALDDGTDQPMSSIALDWMIQRVEKETGLHFKAHPWRTISAKHAEQHERFGLLYRRWGRTLRNINKTKLMVVGRPVAAIASHLSPIGEAIHESALKRLGWDVLCNGTMRCYAPENVVPILDLIEDTYNPSPVAEPLRATLRIVATSDARHLDPDDMNDRSFAQELCREARKRLAGAMANPASAAAAGSPVAAN